MKRRAQDHDVDLTCYGIDPEPYACQVDQPEDRGEYFFSPMASLITGAARLMLGLLELSVLELGGTYAMEDTDSMAVVATEHGGLVPCPNNWDENAVVQALSWKQVETIRQRFAALNPYNRALVPGSVLRLEEDNLDPATGKQRQIHCYAISAKRYCLFVLDAKGEPVLLKKGANNPKDHFSQHGLGHLLNPLNPDEDTSFLVNEDDGLLDRVHTMDRSGLQMFGSTSCARLWAFPSRSYHLRMRPPFHVLP